ncbi:hypothetical protein AVV67_gp250 [Escherichia phage vB_EcoM_VR25]|uniref:Uncharacterized protein n=1 Tax=Escherichia phage vB_EcoM_VR25 TaxID=1567028 RepID=A0A0A7HD00_9CAUD|nr:hypothetical protein AVV67_gp250 [Escherichia phage vB_EcoM_VR25]AIZ02538.1 hypothetical protein VR25_194 [Escherichia phage vB_EcoM_VR25]
MTFAEELRQMAKESQDKVANDFIVIFRKVAIAAAENGKDAVNMAVSEKEYEEGNRTKISDFLRAEKFTSFTWNYNWQENKPTLYVKF